MTDKKSYKIIKSDDVKTYQTKIKSVEKIKHPFKDEYDLLWDYSTAYQSSSNVTTVSVIKNAIACTDGKIYLSAGCEQKDRTKSNIRCVIYSSSLQSKPPKIIRSKNFYNYVWRNNDVETVKTLIVPEAVTRSSDKTITIKTIPERIVIYEEKESRMTIPITKDEKFVGILNVNDDLLIVTNIQFMFYDSKTYVFKRKIEHGREIVHVCRNSDYVFVLHKPKRKNVMKKVLKIKKKLVVSMYGVSTLSNDNFMDDGDHVVDSVKIDSGKSTCMMAASNNKLVVTDNKKKILLFELYYDK